jgi:hypothetical protein
VALSATSCRNSSPVGFFHPDSSGLTRTLAPEFCASFGIPRHKFFINLASQMPTKVPRAGAHVMKTSITDFFTYYKNLDGYAKEAIYESLPIVNPEGRQLSEPNTIFLAFQSPIKFTVVAGFKQWMKHGRCVKKGEHGVLIFIPAMNKSKHKDEQGNETVTEELDRFLVATVFDISQTFEIKEKAEKKEPALCHADAE